MKYVNLFLSILVMCMLTACANEKKMFEEALDAGNLKEAENHLKKVSDLNYFLYGGGLLIEEYLSLENVDRAIYVFEHITGHCTMYQMQYTSLYRNADYTQKYSIKIYDALLKNGRYDEAWGYHALKYDAEDYPGNAHDYFDYMSDVIIELCNARKYQEAERFIRQKSIWFLTNVNHHEYGDDYPNNRYEIMSEELNMVYKNAR